MRILYLGNNWVGWQILRWLKEQGEEIAGLGLHPPEKRRYGDEILACAGVDPAGVLDGSRLRRPETLERIKALNADIALSVLFDYIFRPDFIRLFRNGVVNLHPSYLPYNRGQYPNVWSIVEGTPAGATLHYVDEGVDTGETIAQKQVPVEPVDTGETLYRKLERACVELFQEAWPSVRSGNARPFSQEGAGTYHRTIDVERIDEIDLERSYTGKEIIDIIRARTFPPYPGAYFRHEGRKVYLRMQLYYG